MVKLNTRIWLAGVMVLCMLVSVNAQPSSDSLWSFSKIRTDLNDDGIPDYLEESVTVTGIVNIASGLLHERFLQAFIQNDSSGISIFAREIKQPISVGDSLVVHGKIQQYNGLTEVSVESYSIHTAKKSSVKSHPLSHVVVNPQKYLGALVHGTATVIEKGNIFNGKFIRLTQENSDANILGYVSNFHTFNNQFNFSLLQAGDKVNIKGIFSEYNPEFPEHSGYRILLRTPSDLSYQMLPRFYWYIILGVFAIAVIVVISWLVILKNRVNAKTREIQVSLEEKELLLREIHHRVKNSLSIVSGLLDLQEANTDSKEAKEVLQNSQSRIQSVGLIHEKLYKLASLSDIELDVYIKDLVKTIHKTFSSEMKNVELAFELDPVSLETSRAIPCGLLINELIVNAFKHAYREGEKGTLKIALKNRGDSIMLQVSDNGRGLPDEFDPNNEDSLGSMLIHLFTEQLDAKMDVASSPEEGTSFCFSFPL